MKNDTGFTGSGRDLPLALHLLKKLMSSCRSEQQTVGIELESEAYSRTLLHPPEMIPSSVGSAVSFVIENWETEGGACG